MSIEETRATLAEAIAQDAHVTIQYLDTKLLIKPETIRADAESAHLVAYMVDLKRWRDFRLEFIRDVVIVDAA